MNMSFSLTTPQVRAGTKTVTRRRDGTWGKLVPGSVLWACEKTMGLKKGEHIVKIRPIRVVDVRREPLYMVLVHGWTECSREGFPHLTPDEFIEFFMEHMGGSITQKVLRIEFEYLCPCGVAVGTPPGQHTEGCPEWLPF